MNHKYPSREESKRVVLNGPRPSPLRLINKDSHVIQKSSLAAKQQQVLQQNLGLGQPRKQPVIIYTHSPKIIHTKPKDFMALVQKLTGFTRSGHEDTEEYHNRDKKSEKSAHQDNDSSSVTSDIDAASEVSPVHRGAVNGYPCLTDFPLFTPNTNNLFSLSPQSVFRYTDRVVFTSPHVNLSPSFVEFMKGLPE